MVLRQSPKAFVLFVESARAMRLSREHSEGIQLCCDDDIRALDSCLKISCGSKSKYRRTGPLPRWSWKTPLAGATAYRSTDVERVDPQEVESASLVYSSALECLVWLNSKAAVEHLDVGLLNIHLS